MTTFYHPYTDPRILQDIGSYFFFWKKAMVE